MDVLLKILPTADNLLVHVMHGSPFDHGQEYQIELIENVTTRPGPPVFGEVLAVGPSPFIHDDDADQDERVDMGDIVLFPPTSGFIIPSGRSHSAGAEYRIIRASALAGKLIRAQA